jgi:hypothetical protein
MVTIFNPTIGSGRQPCRILRLFRLREHPSGLTIAWVWTLFMLPERMIAASTQRYGRSPCERADSLIQLVLMSAFRNVFVMPNVLNSYSTVILLMALRRGVAATLKISLQSGRRARNS